MDISPQPLYYVVVIEILSTRQQSMYYIKAIKIKEILFHDRLYCLYDYNINILMKSSDLL